MPALPGWSGAAAYVYANACDNGSFALEKRILNSEYSAALPYGATSPVDKQVPEIAHWRRDFNHEAAEAVFG